MGNDLQKETESSGDSQQAGSGTNVDERSSTVTQPPTFSSSVDPPCLQHEIENCGRESIAEATDNRVTMSTLTDEFESKDGK